jgi:hypothetical protein
MTDIKIFGRWLEAPDKTDTSYTAIRKVIKSEINIPVYIWYDGDAYTTNAEDHPDAILCETEDEEERYRLLV